MSWQLGLSRFIHGALRFDALTPTSKPAISAPLHAQVALQGGLTADREARLLPALICSLFDCEGRCASWPPTRVSELLDLAGLDKAGTGRHLQGPNLPPSFFRGPMPRWRRQAVLMGGLAALDAGLLEETGALFDELSPTLRGYVLNAFEHGHLGLAQAAAQQFMDCLVETVTFAFLNWELELTPLAGDSHHARAWHG